MQGIERSIRVIGRRTAAWVAGAALLSLGWPAAAGAAAGVTEINQAKALAGGVTPGDTPGFPVTLSAGGSYVLSSNLVVSAANIDGLVVSSAVSVSIDLNGFAIKGPVVCTGRGAALTCTPTVTGGSAIYQTGAGAVSVRNGFLQGFRYGVAFGNECVIEDVITTSHQEHGFIVGARCRFAHVVASRNGGNGIDTDEGCQAIENIAFANRGAGIRFRAPGGMASGNVVRGNGSLGLRAGAGSVLSANNASDNGGDGIQTVTGSTVVGNLSFNNAGYQISAGANAGFTNNVVAETGALPAISGGVYLPPNMCNGQQTEAACR